MTKTEDITTLTGSNTANSDLAFFNNNCMHVTNIKVCMNLLWSICLHTNYGSLFQSLSCCENLLAWLSFGKTGVLRWRWHSSVYLFRRFTERCRKKNWCSLGIAQITFFNLLAHTNVCSHAMVLYAEGNLSSALYNNLHLGSTWFLRWRRSITFDNIFHAWLSGGGEW